MKLGVSLQSPLAHGIQEGIHPLINVPERIFAQDGLVCAIVQFQVHPVHRVVAAQLLCSSHKISPQFRARCLWWSVHGIFDIGFGDQPACCTTGLQQEKDAALP